MIQRITDQSCGSFWDCVTPDGKLNALSTALTIIGAFLVAYFTSNRQKNLQDNINKESSKKIYLAHKERFKKVTATCEMLIKGKNTNANDINLFIRGLKKQLELLKESKIIVEAPSDIYEDITKFISDGETIANYCHQIQLLIEEENYERIEEYLLDENIKHREDVNFYRDEAEALYSDLEFRAEKIKRYYK